MAEKEEKTVSKDNRLAKPGETVELVTGEQWVDELSGISLYRGFYRLASQNELKSNKTIRETGYIREEEKAPTALIPKDKDLTRVEKALRLGILKIFDPKNPTVYKERPEFAGKRVLDATQDRGSRYVEPEDEKIASLLKLGYNSFVTELKGYKSLQMLERIYDAECEGGNPTAGPRKSYVEAVRSRMKDKDISGVGRVTSKVSEVIKMG